MAATPIGVFWMCRSRMRLSSVNFIIHKGDDKDPGPDQSMMPEKTPAVWIKSMNETIYQQACAADGEFGSAILHYHRPDGDYGDYTSTNYADFWGLHTWGSRNRSGLGYAAQAGRGGDLLAHALRCRAPTPPRWATSFTVGDTKDPGPDQSLDFAKWGCEVWQPQGADPATPYILPILRGDGGCGRPEQGQGPLDRREHHRLGREVQPRLQLQPELRHGRRHRAQRHGAGRRPGDPAALRPAGSHRRAESKVAASGQLRRLQDPIPVLEHGSGNPQGPVRGLRRHTGLCRRRYRRAASRRAGRSLHLRRPARGDLERRRAHPAPLGADRASVGERCSVAHSLA